MRYFVTGYYSIIYLIFFLLLLADIRFYHYFDTHLNFLAIEYINEGATFYNLILSESYFYLFIGLSVLSTFLIIIVKRKILNKIEKTPLCLSISSQTIYFIVFIVLFGIGLRGRLSTSPLDWGIAYISNNRFINQLALNGIYTLGKNLTETNNDPRLSFVNPNERFEFIPIKDCLNDVKAILTQPNQRWLNDNSLLRVIEQPKKLDFNPNIIIVIMESWSANLTGALGDSRHLTPNFDRLSKSGVLFNNFYSNGVRTNYGLSALLCSFPSLPGRAIMKRYDAYHPFSSLSEILFQRGYNNSFIYGGDIAFDNMKGFFREKKYDHFVDEDNFDMFDKFSKWGVPDHTMLSRTVPITDSLPRPFMITALTLSNHEPFDLPDSTIRKYFDDADSSKIYNSQIYADYAIGKFIDEIKTKPVFDSTIFVFVSDHSRLVHTLILTDPQYIRIPLLIYAPSIIADSGIVVDKYGSQIDFIPTLMDIVGGNYEYQGWGRNLLTLPDDDNGYAFICIWNRMMYLDREYLFFEDYGDYDKIFKNLSGYFILIEDKEIVKNEIEFRQTRLRRLAQSAEQLSTPSVDNK